jgi:hypothetical protein
MKTITGKVIALAIALGGIIFSHNSMAACNAPTGMNTTSITSSSATLNWNTVSNASLGYNVRYRVVGVSSWTSTTATTNSKAISSLNSSANYEWQVQSRCSSTQTSSWTSSSTFTTLILCNTPTGLSTTNISTSGATLNWTAISGASGYNIQYRVVGATSWTNTTSTSNSKALTSLTASTNYEWQVQTNCGSSNLSSYSSTATFSTPAPPCNVPSALNATGVTFTDATLNWTTVSGAVGYNIQYRVVGVSSWTSTTSTTNSKAISSLASGSNYEFQVQTNCGNSNLSSFSASSTFTTLIPPPPPPCSSPSGLTTTGITSSGATIGWQAASGSLAYYIQYREIGQLLWNSASTTSTTFVFSSLNASTNYEWQVQNDCGNSNFSSASTIATFTTLSPAATCAIPSGTVVNNITLTSATLQWEAAVNANLYNVQFRKVGDLSWTVSSTADKWLDLNSLLPSTQYEWQVQSDCGNSTVSAFSDDFKFYTSMLPVCNNIPMGLTVSDITPSTALLSWSGGANDAMIVGYEVQYREVGSSSWNSLVVTQSSVAISSLNPGQIYEWQVRANCGASVLSAFSSVVSFTTLAHAAPINTNQYIAYTPNPQDPLSWITVFGSTGDYSTDAQIVHDWLLSHGCIFDDSH